jgi:hypothetical protein
LVLQMTRFLTTAGASGERLDSDRTGRRPEARDRVRHSCPGTAAPMLIRAVFGGSHSAALSKSPCFITRDKKVR